MKWASVTAVKLAKQRDYTNVSIFCFQWKPQLDNDSCCPCWWKDEIWASRSITWHWLRSANVRVGGSTKRNYNSQGRTIMFSSVLFLPCVLYTIIWQRDYIAPYELCNLFVIIVERMPIIFTDLLRNDRRSMKWREADGGTAGALHSPAFL